MILAFFILLFLDRYFGFLTQTFEPAPPPPLSGSKDNLRLLNYPRIICLYARGQERSCSGVLPILYAKQCTETVHHQDAAIYAYGNFQETSMVSFTICVMIILTPKQFPGLSLRLSYLQNSTQILNMIEISAV